MIVSCKPLSIKFLAVLVLSLCFLCVYPAAAQTDQTAIELQSANIAVGKAFNAVLDAEKSGANVTDLIAQINTAQGILAQAENSYRTGDSTTTANQADSVLPLAQQITTAAQSAKQTALTSKQNSFYSTLALAVIGPIVFILVLLFVWRKFKGKYIENLSETKPEVTNP
jgi:hypothetical protein